MPQFIYIPSAAAALSFAFVGSTLSTGASCTPHASAQAGDLCIYFAVALGSGIAADVTPSGYTNIINDTFDQGANAFRIRIDYKILAGGDLGVARTGIDGTVADDKTMYVFRPSIALATVVPFSINTQTIDTDPTLQTINTAGQAAPCILIGHTDASTSGTASGTLTTSGIGPAAGQTFQKTYYEIQTSLANRTFDCNDSGSIQGLQSFGLAFTT